MTRTEKPVLLYSKNACEFHGDHSKITTRRCHAAILFAWKFRTTEYIKESFAAGIQQICTFAWLSSLLESNKTARRSLATLLWHSMQHAFVAALFLLFAVLSLTFAVCFSRIDCCAGNPGAADTSSRRHRTLAQITTFAIHASLLDSLIGSCSC